MSIRLTQKRKRILDVLRVSHAALSAKDLHERLPDINLVTVYRNLELFVQEKMIHQLHFCSGEALYEYQAEPHHHALCEECHRVIHFTAPDKKLKRLLQLDNFDVAEIEVTVRGKCRPRKPRRCYNNS